MPPISNTAFRGKLETEKNYEREIYGTSSSWSRRWWRASNAPADIFLELHVKYVGNAKILINKTMSDIPTEFGASSCMIMLTMRGTGRASVW